MSEYLELKMAPNFKEAIFSGAKAITIRDGERPQFKFGMRVHIVSSDGSWDCWSTVDSACFYTYRTTPRRDWKEDGFRSKKDMIKKLKRFYPDIKPNSENTVIRWGVVTDMWQR